MKKNNLNSLRLLFILLVSVVINVSCTKEIEGKLPTVTTRYIVDGYIESNAPPFVVLSRSSNVFNDLNISDPGSFLLHGAQIKVSTGNDTTTLVEYCLKDLPFPDSTKALVLASLGIVTTDTSKIPNVCVYTVPDIFNYFFSGTCQFKGQENKSYNLWINYENTVMTATNTIPRAIGIDSLSWKKHPSATNDTLATVLANIDVPPTYGNFIRYWTKRNKETYYAPLSQSVYDDKFFSGKKLALPLERGQSPYADNDRYTYGYFWRGDTVTLKWANIDAATFDFFYTLENDGTNNPFTSPVKVKSNINNGFGIWAGYGVSLYTIKIPQ